MMKCVPMKVGQSKKNKWEYMMVNDVSQIAYLWNITIDRMAMGMYKERMYGLVIKQLLSIVVRGGVRWITRVKRKTWTNEQQCNFVERVDQTVCFIAVCVLKW